MSAITDTIPFGLSLGLRPLLDSMVGETPDAKIANLMDAMGWDDLIAEKRHWLQQLRTLWAPL
jgi:hypothetical protein